MYTPVATAFAVH